MFLYIYYIDYKPSVTDNEIGYINCFTYYNHKLKKKMFCFFVGSILQTHKNVPILHESRNSLQHLRESLFRPNEKLELPLTNNWSD